MTKKYSIVLDDTKLGVICVNVTKIEFLRTINKLSEKYEIKTETDENKYHNKIEYFANETLFGIIHESLNIR